MKKKIYIGALVLTCGLIIGCADSAPPAQEPSYETAGQTAVETGEPTLTATLEPEHFGLSDARELQLQESFLAWIYANTNKELLPYRPTIWQYFGTFSRREVVFMDTWEFVNHGEIEEVVAGYTFVFPHSGRTIAHGNDQGGVHIWLHDDGDWMCFCIGYERGYLTAEDIGLIWERYMGNMGE
ncbi:MAG: hypothetical protein FWE06_10165 [Oscillospiraceae bacterium]|nr:hypothetical protein [Oscillospiraceae bacterium]